MRTYSRWLLWCMLSLLAGELHAQDFKQYFADSTLRLDYILAGTQSETKITPEETHLLTGWAGRRHHLDSLVLQGTARLWVRDEASGKLIYCHSFNTLYQEWRLTDEAKSKHSSYEEVQLIPVPKQAVLVTVELSGAQGEIIAQQTQRIDPRDILIHRHSAQPKYRTEYLLHSGSSADCIDLAILAEGYTEAELPTFLADARAATEAIFSYEPFKSRRAQFNVVAVLTPSAESGVAVPRFGRWPRTAFGSHFDTFYSERYLTTRRLKSVHDALTGIPYEHIIILANTDVYGGGGFYNSYLLSSTHHKDFLPVIVHEFGHSFGGLADEYFYDQDTMTDTYSTKLEPWEQNVTNLRDFEGKKWSGLIPRKTPRPTPAAQAKKYPIGLYEGAAYSTKGMYRASYDCRMRTNHTKDFCPACHLALDKLLQYYLNK